MSWNFLKSKVIFKYKKIQVNPRLKRLDYSESTNGNTWIFWYSSSCGIFYQNPYDERISALRHV